MALIRKLPVHKRHKKIVPIQLMMRMGLQQAIQNTVVFAGLVFSRQYVEIKPILLSLGVFVILTIISISIAAFAHVINRERGEWKYIFMTLHGKFPYTALLGMLIPALIAFFIDYRVGWLFLFYIFIAVLHDLYLVRIIIWDVLVLALEFSLKAYAGIIVIPSAVVSPWLIACAFLLSVTVSLGQRRNEVFRSAQPASVISLEGRAPYSGALLDQMLAVVTSTTFMAYTLYTISDRARQLVGDTRLIYTIPYVLFGILRFLYLIYRRDTSTGIEIAIIKDRWILCTVLAWLITIILLMN